MITLKKKSYKIVGRNNEAQISGFEVAKKAPSL